MRTTSRIASRYYALTPSCVAGANDAQKTAGIILTVLAAAGHAASDAEAPDQYAHVFPGYKM
jgi:phosphate/sulfate permease